jgi:tRNA nucleotidyltransferase (CCA-adding enzyme)
MDLLDRVIKKITPSKTEVEKINSVINISKEKLCSEIKKDNINAEIVLGGSVAKGTWLRGKADIDFFVRFDGYPEEQIGQMLSSLVKRAFGKCTIMHGSRDYCKVNFAGYELEFIPVLKINSPADAKNSMDASPFHVEYVRSKISENERLADEIRLFKKFSRAQGVYGAETHVSGISGYVSELLMIHFKSFENLVKKAENMVPPIFIDIEKHYSSVDEIKHFLSKSKLSSPIILIDPILKTRNASASLSYATFSKLLLSLRLFKRKPSTFFFNEKKITIDSLIERSKKRGTILVYEYVKPGNVKKDVFLAKIKRVIGKIKSDIEREDIHVYDYGFVSEETPFVFFEISTLALPKVKKHYGPPVWVRKENFDAFLSKWKNVRVEGNLLISDVRRKEVDVEKIVRRIIKEGIKSV